MSHSSSKSKCLSSESSHPPSRRQLATQWATPEALPGSQLSGLRAKLSPARASVNIGRNCSTELRMNRDVPEPHYCSAWPRSRTGNLERGARLLLARTPVFGSVVARRIGLRGASEIATVVPHGEAPLSREIVFARSDTGDIE